MTMSAQAMSAQAIGRELAKIAFNLEQTHGAGYDRYFGAFVFAAQFVKDMGESGVEFSTHMAFDAEIKRLLDDLPSSSH
jgi:hypothetical protein